MKRVGAMRTRAYASGNPAARRASSTRTWRACARRCSRCCCEQADCFARAAAASWRRTASGSPPGTSSTDAQRARGVATTSTSHVSPALTPLSLDPSHPFPFMSNLSTSWGFVLRDAETAETRARARQGADRRCRSGCRCAAGVPAGERCFVSLQELVRHNAAQAVPRRRRSSRRRCSASRATPTSRSRRTATTASGSWSRSRCASGASSRSCGSSSARRRSAEIRDGLVDRFELRDSDVYELPGMLDYTTLFEIASLPVPRAARPAVDAAGRRSASTPRRTSSRRSAPATCWCITRTRASTRRSSASSATRPTTRARPPSR